MIQEQLILRLLKNLYYEIFIFNYQEDIYNIVKKLIKFYS